MKLIVFLIAWVVAFLLSFAGYTLVKGCQVNSYISKNPNMTYSVGNVCLQFNPDIFTEMKGKAKSFSPIGDEKSLGLFSWYFVSLNYRYALKIRRWNSDTIDTKKAYSFFTVVDSLYNSKRKFYLMADGKGDKFWFSHDLKMEIDIRNTLPFIMMKISDAKQKELISSIEIIDCSTEDNATGGRE